MVHFQIGKTIVILASLLAQTACSDSRNLVADNVISETVTYADFLKCQDAGNNHCLPDEQAAIVGKQSTQYFQKGYCCRNDKSNPNLKEQPCYADAMPLLYCTNKVSNDKFKMFASPSQAPCPIDNIIYIGSLKQVVRVSDRWSAIAEDKFSPRICKFKVSAYARINAKITVSF